MKKCTKLNELRKKLTESCAQPEDVFRIEIKREARNYLIAELSCRKERLLRSVSAPDIKPENKTKSQRLLFAVNDMLDQLNNPISTK